MFRVLLTLLLLLSSTAVFAEKPKTLSVTYPILGTRTSLCSAVAIGPNLVLSCDHAVRDEKTNLGDLIAVNRKWDWALIKTDEVQETYSVLRDVPLTPGETLYFNGGTIRVNDQQQMIVTSGKLIDGMSGGPIWDKEDRVVSVISEYEIDAKILFGYTTELADWVAEVTEKAPAPLPVPPMPTVGSSPVPSVVGEDALAALRARIASLLAAPGPAQGDTVPSDKVNGPNTEPVSPLAPQGASPADSERIPPTIRLTYYGAAWCGPCVRIGMPGMNRLLEEHPELKELVQILDHDLNRQQAREHGVGSIPCYVITGPDGKILGKRTGAMQASAVYDFYTKVAAEYTANSEEEKSTSIPPYVRVWIGRGGGSGVVVGRRGDEWLVLTASHVVNNSMGIKPVVQIGEERRPAKILKDSGFYNGQVHQRIDLSLLSIPAEDEQVQTYPVAGASPPIGSKVKTHGYPGIGSYRPRDTVVSGHERGRLLVRGSIQGGESGCAVVYDGQVVGIMSTSDFRSTGYANDVDIIREFLTEAKAERAEATPSQDNSSLRSKIAEYKASGGGRYYVMHGRRTIKTPKSHLVSTHGWEISQLEGMSQDELDLLHGASHTGRIRPPKDHPPGDESAVHESTCKPGTGRWINRMVEGEVVPTWSPN